MAHRTRAIILAVLCCASTGCHSMMSPRDAWRQTVSSFRPDTRDYADGSTESGSEWDFVGEEGRGDQERERDPDPWFKQNLMSPKAQSIERNLGID